MARRAGGNARIALRSSQNRPRVAAFRSPLGAGNQQRGNAISNKNDLIGVVADKTGLTKAQAADAVDASSARTRIA